MTRKHILTLALLLCRTAFVAAQDFFNLTAEQVRIDTVLPSFHHSADLGTRYADSTYSVTIEYPEFIDMTAADIARYKAITADVPPALPVVSTSVSVSRKRGSLDVSLVPVVFRNGRFMKLVSFRLAVTATAVRKSMARAAGTGGAASGERYAAHSVLRSGNWAKIRVPASGIYRITDELIRQAGFSNHSKIRIYGYGGALQPERLTAAYLEETDDLKEVPTCTVNGRRLFYARGPVTWKSSDDRDRNPYSDYGYYFITEAEGDPLTVDADAFIASCHPSADDSNTLYEVDDYAWYHGGRNLYDAQPLTTDSPGTYTIASAGTSADGRLRIVVSADRSMRASVSINDSIVGTVTVSGTTTATSAEATSVAVVSNTPFNVHNLRETNTVTIKPEGAGTMRLDYIVVHSDTPKAAPDPATAAFPVPEYVYRITNQDLHGDGPADMIIIIPTTQKLKAQAERLKALHEQQDGMRVRIVPADEIFNEFSSGTPDATAYKRYAKMLYDRAATDADAPKHLLLLGDAAWDNRMLSAAWRSYSPDDFLLSFQSRNSVSKTRSYVADDFFCLLDDGEALSTTPDSESLTSNGSFNTRTDIAVGRIPARTAEEARIVVDKTIDYASNRYAGEWQNTVVFMGDDGNNNEHMDGANRAAAITQKNAPGTDVKKVFWDAYTRESSATGNRFPDVERIVKQHMTSGALLMNYTGHGDPRTISHEQVLKLDDFRTTASKNLPLWYTAACDIAPFDGQEENIGETALFNRNGGAVVFIGTARTVYAAPNMSLNNAFVTELFSPGREITVGEAQRLAKNDLVSPQTGSPYSSDLSENRMQYVLLGDPALKPARPMLTVAIDDINGSSTAGTDAITLKAGEPVTVKGHIENGGQAATDFNGTVTANVKDAEEQIVCKLANTDPKDGSDRAYVYYDRNGQIYRGTDSVRNGQFTISFVVPKDIRYSDGNCLITAYAINNGRTATANGSDSSFRINGSAVTGTDSIGPSVYCYLNSASFSNGGDVNPTPYFVAEIYDEGGINASGNGIGHDLELIIDGDMTKTYILNDNFSYDFGSYKSGSVGYSIPRLEPGRHKLLFRAWDVQNNSSVAELTFNVVDGLEPGIISAGCTRNPATTSTAFRIVHDRTGCDVDVTVEVFDMSGRMLWTHSESSHAADGVTEVEWDLTTNSGGRLGTGVYLYRVNVSSDGSSYASQAKKLIVISNK